MFFRITATFADGRVQSDIVCQQLSATLAAQYATNRFSRNSEMPAHIAAQRVDFETAARIAESGGTDWRL